MSQPGRGDASNASASANAGAGGGGSLEPVWLGVGSPRPQPRLLQNAMFGHVADAFDEKSIFKIGQQPRDRPAPSNDRQSTTAAVGDDHATTTNTTTTTDAATAADGMMAADSAESRASIRDESGPSDGALSGSGSSSSNRGVVNQLQPSVAYSSPSVDGAAPLLIRGGRVVNDDSSFDADVFIVDGKITAVGENLAAADGARVIDARGKLVMPAGIDTSVHFQSSHPASGSAGPVSVDDVYHGTKAALSAGNTTVVDVVVAKKSESLSEAFERRRAMYESKSCCDYSLRVAVTSWSPAVQQDMQRLVTDKGVNSFVLCLSDDSSDADLRLYEALKHCRQIGALAVINADTHPSFSALKAAELAAEGFTGPEAHLLSHPQDMEASNVYHAVTVASQANAALCVANVTGKLSADIVARSRRRGKVVFAEVMLPALVLSGNSYYDNSWSRAAAMVTSPPLRPAADTANCLINRLANGEAECVASDHCAFNMAQKAVGKDDFRLIPAGVNGVAERLALVWDRTVVSGKMDVCRFVAVTSTNAAKLLNVYPRKGRISVGSDADLIVWDNTALRPPSASSHATRADVNVYDAMSPCATATCVVYAGHVVVDSNGLHVNEPTGQYLETPPHSEFVFGRISARDQVRGAERVERDPSSMPSALEQAGSVSENAAGTRTVYRGDTGPYCRPPTSSGGRNMQDSSFTLSGMSDSGDMDDALKPSKKGCGTKISQPPGGRTSTQLW